MKLWETLERELITEVMLNDDDRVFVERSGVGIEDAGVRMGHAARAALVKTAATLGEERPREGYPIIEAALPPPLRWRFSAFLPPITSAAVVTIRIPSERVFRLESYLRHDQISIGQFEALQEALCGP
ncbi:MAG TPA: hypothetical protein VFX59_22050, partial [Polyangiales bacterium]|nr:hypothetical protein [Polyangiales bacterium]